MKDYGERNGAQQNVICITVLSDKRWGCEIYSTRTLEKEEVFVFATFEKKNPNTLKGVRIILIWRRRWDLNPRAAFTAYEISRNRHLVPPRPSSSQFFA